MKQTWHNAALGVRRRIRSVAAFYHAARATFEVLRLLDQEALLASAPVRSRRRPFVARPGFVV